MTLEQDQKDFIKQKVKELKSINKVKEVYNKDCTVDKFANAYAKKFLKKNEDFCSKLGKV